MEIIILGSGTSGCVPNISCLIETPVVCKVCLSAIQQYPQKSDLSPTKYTKNRRRNTSALIRAPHSDGRVRNIVIDCGKTFYESALTWFVEYRFRQIDAVLLTHGHADAILGLDDLRQWTLRSGKEAIQESIHVYLDAATMESVARAFPYMVDTRNATGGGEVAALQFHLIEQDENGVLPFIVEETKIIPFEGILISSVEHGKFGNGDPFYALGFRVDDISYISDTNRLPEKAKDIIKDSKVIIMDALRRILD